MTGFLQFAVLGLGVGAIYALLAQGITFIQAGSGVLNLAHGAMALLAAQMFRVLRDEQYWPFAVAFVVTIGAMAILGAVIYQMIMRPLRHASTLARVVATLGILILIQASVQLIWGVYPDFLNPFFTLHSFVVRDVTVPYDRVWLTIIAVGITGLLWLFYRFAPAGLAVKAGATNPRTVGTLGWSPDALATLTWSIGCALAGLAGILIAPITGIASDEMPLLVIPTLAAALIGGFTSLWWTLAGAFAIGIGQAEISQYWPTVRGLHWTLPFVVILVILTVRGKGLPVRGFFVERLPEVGSGRVRYRWLIPLGILMSCLVLFVFPALLLDALTITFAWATILLSVVVLLGYTSQLSFEQMTMAGLSALVAGRLVADWGWPFEIAFIAALATAVPIGVLFALPALRTRGINLAVVTLAAGMVIFEVVFSNERYTGGLDGTPVGPQSVFGISVDGVTHANRYCFLVLVLFVASGWVVANLRRGRGGRRLLAVRTNERAAAALGISVFATKLYAFIVGASLAGIGGILLAFQSRIIDYGGFAPFSSILAVGYAVLGSVGFVVGSLVGEHWHSWVRELDQCPTLFGGQLSLFGSGRGRNGRPRPFARLGRHRKHEHQGRKGRTSECTRVAEHRSTPAQSLGGLSSGHLWCAEAADASRTSAEN